MSMRMLFILMALMGVQLLAYGDGGRTKKNDLIIFPGKFVYQQEGNLSASKYTGAIRSLTFINNSSESITIEAIEFKFFKDGKSVDSSYLFSEELYKEAKKTFNNLGKGGSGNTQGLRFSPSRVLDVQEAIKVDSKMFTFDVVPDQVQIRIVGTTEDVEYIEELFVLDLDNTYQKSLKIISSKKPYKLNDYATN